MNSGTLVLSPRTIKGLFMTAHVNKITFWCWKREAARGFLRDGVFQKDGTLKSHKSVLFFLFFLLHHSDMYLTWTIRMDFICLWWRCAVVEARCCCLTAYIRRPLVFVLQSSIHLPLIKIALRCQDEQPHRKTGIQHLDLRYDRLSWIRPSGSPDAPSQWCWIHTSNLVLWWMHFYLSFHLWSQKLMYDKRVCLFWVTAVMQDFICVW